METTENDLTVNDHDPEGARATDERDSFIPRAYDKYWETLGTSRDRGNKKHKRNRGPNPIKKLTNDLRKMKAATAAAAAEARIEQNKTKGGKKRKTKKSKKLKRKRKTYKRKHRNKKRDTKSRKKRTKRKRRRSKRTRKK